LRRATVDGLRFVRRKRHAFVCQNFPSLEAWKAGQPAAEDGVDNDTPTMITCWPLSGAGSHWQSDASFEHMFKLEIENTTVEQVATAISEALRTPTPETVLSYSRLPSGAVRVVAGSPVSIADEHQDGITQ
jgi:hypothetical protein